MSYVKICSINNVTPNLGVGVLLDGEQIALFRIVDVDKKESFHAVSNYDPFSKVNVISRGLVGSMQGRTVVASPIYKQHFCLETGQCLEDESAALKVWPVKIEAGQVFLKSQSVIAA